MKFIDLNWDINKTHKCPRRVNEVYSQVLLGLESVKDLGLTNKYSTSPMSPLFGGFTVVLPDSPTVLCV